MSMVDMATDTQAVWVTNSLLLLIGFAGWVGVVDWPSEAS